MLLAELLAAVLLAAVIGLLVFFLFGRGSAWEGFWAFWVVLFLGVWAFGALMEPVGPTLWGVAWLPFLLAALVFALLLASVPAPPRDTAEARAPTTRQARQAVGLVFWFLIGVLVLLVVFAYWSAPVV